jgi:hypothetical protein
MVWLDVIVRHIPPTIEYVLVSAGKISLVSVYQADIIYTIQKIRSF